MTTVESDLEENHLDCISHQSMTDVGMRREENQDSLGIIERGQFKFFIVADGMGGVQGGAIASSLAIEVVKAFLTDRTSITPGDLIGAVGAANHAIFERGVNEPTLNGMGTTFVGLCFHHEQLFVVNVGDSRAYCIRDGTIEQMTTDHTLIHELLRTGAITEDQVENHPVAHMLTRSLGPAPEIQVDCDSCSPFPGDRYLLCSDGLYNHVKAEEILDVVESQSADVAVETLVSMANERGGTDNITVLLVEVGNAFPFGGVPLPDDSADPLDIEHAVDPEDTMTGGAGVAESDVDTLEKIIPVNGRASNGLKESSSPEITATVGGASQQRLIQHAMDQVRRSGDGPQHVVSTPPASRRVVTFLVVATCVALSTFALLFWHSARSAEKSTIAQNQPPESETVSALVVPAVSARVFSGAESQEKVSTPEAEQVPAAESENSEVPQVAAAQAETEKDPVGADERKDAEGAAVTGSETVPETGPVNASSVPEEDVVPSVVAKIERIREQIEILGQKEEMLTTRIESFSQPLSGSAALLLGEASRTVDRLAEKIEQIEAELAQATKRLAVWYGQEQRLQSTEILKLASEVAPLSDAVAAQKARFEDVTWQYLKKRERLQYEPENEDLRAEVTALIEERKEELKELDRVLREAISDEMSILDSRITELTEEKTLLKDQAAAAAEELEYVQALMSQDPERQVATRKRLKAQLAETRSEKESLQELVTSLYEEAVLMEP